MKLLVFLLVVCASAQDFSAISQQCVKPPSTQLVSLSDKIALPAIYKVSGSVTNWHNLVTSIIVETSSSTSKTLILKSRDHVSEKYVSDVSTGKSAVMNFTSGDCQSNVTLRQLVESPRLQTLLGDTSSFNSIVAGLLKLSDEHKGFLKDESEPQVVGGVETVSWVSCILGTEPKQTNVVVEVRYAGERSVRPAQAPFDNPLLISLRIAEFSSFNDSTAVTDFSIELDRYELPTYEDEKIEHGYMCKLRPSSALPASFDDEFAATLTYHDASGKREISDAFYSTSRKVFIANGTFFNFSSSDYNQVPNESAYFVHDLKYGYETIAKPNSCVSLNTLTNATRDVVVSPGGGLLLAPLSTLFVEPGLEFEEYPHDNATSFSTLKSYRAKTPDFEVLEADIEDGRLVELRKYRSGKLFSVLRITSRFAAPSDISSFADRLVAGCYGQPTANSTWTMEISKKTIKDVYSVNVLHDSIVNSLSNIAVVNRNRISTFWSDTVDGGLQLMVRVNEKTQTPAANVSFDFDSEATTDILFAKLNQSVIAQEWKIEVPVDSGSQTWFVVPSTLEIFPKRESGPSFVGYTGGSMLVLAIFCIIAGASLGVGGFVFVTRRQRISTLAYQVFE